MSRRSLLLQLLLVIAVGAKAQYNIDRLLTSGQIALSYDDYVLSIQYFNRIIELKPYIYQPWQYRAAAKFYLDDFSGAESDATEAIRLNPFVDNVYDLRAISRIRQKKYDRAIDDYSHAIRLNPTNQNYWLNRAICRMNVKDYRQVHLDIDTIVGRWGKMSQAYALNSETYLLEKDTTTAVKWLDKCLTLDPYNADAWTTRAYISLSRKKWKDADTELGKAIHLKPKFVNNYVNRALARLNVNNLRGAMADYDMALDLDPNNFLAHYNRGLLRMQLGDDNRAITDFDYVIKMEPQNVMAIFNRAVLHDKTGNLRAAIRDYSTVIDQFPNFWTGLSYRASCYRRLGMTAKAELDEFRIFKAQMNKHLGIQPRWTKNMQRMVRKRSEVDPEKYNQIVVEDENTVEHEYKSAFRGHVQNRNVELEILPMFMLSYTPYSNGVNSFQIYDKSVEAFNAAQKPTQHIYVSCSPRQLTEDESRVYFDKIDHLSAQIASTKQIATVLPLLLQRAVTYSVVQNLDAAIADFDTYIQEDTTNVLAYWQRGVCRYQLCRFTGGDVAAQRLKIALAIDDLNRAIKLSSTSSYLYYNRADIYASQKNYEQAIDDYTRAISLEPNLAEAYYNRGVCRVLAGRKKEGISDLSKAGELGIYDAYAILKRYTK
ncbi:tetratricopeptide repeat protein [Prevotella sp.]|uniref:tetratricopeptide repeat protein n=1 Tax=Prevotella sp. TaxID=59823 RepID=UPI002F939701